MTDYVQITTTVASKLEADALADALVERRLAACVQIVGPVASTYRWQGAVEPAEEWICVIKTASHRYAAVKDAIRELHRYETPEIIAPAIVAGSAAYLTWMGEQVTDDA